MSAKCLADIAAYSIASSASASSVGGTLRPSILAVLRLRMKSSWLLHGQVARPPVSTNWRWPQSVGIRLLEGPRRFFGVQWSEHLELRKAHLSAPETSRQRRPRTRSRTSSGCKVRPSDGAASCSSFNISTLDCSAGLWRTATCEAFGANCFQEFQPVPAQFGADAGQPGNVPARSHCDPIMFPGKRCRFC
jgi:hypothetical protein